jgi:hypothetical protein
MQLEKTPFRSNSGCSAFTLAVAASLTQSGLLSAGPSSNSYRKVHFDSLQWPKKVNEDFDERDEKPGLAIRHGQI